MCDTAEQSKQILHALTSNPEFQVYQIKNDFANPNKKSTDYRDIKVILASKFGNGFDELIEVQIIQRI